MVYAYRCSACGHQFDVIKRVAEIDNLESCAKCGTEAKREFVPRVIHLSKTSVQHAEYNPGLGCVVKDAYHRKELCKAKGLEEIGNERVESVHTHFEKSREDAWERGWDKVDGGQWVGNGQSLEVVTPTKPSGEST